MWRRASRRPTCSNGAVWAIEAPSRHVTGRLQEVRVDVAGAPLRFWSREAPLDPSPEAFAGLMLLPAMKNRAELHVAAPLDGSWLLGTRTLSGMFARWWGYPASYPIHAEADPDRSRAPAPGHGLCFTGGVDSFHALFTASSRYDHFVYVAGYETAYREDPENSGPRNPTLDALIASLRSVARETGKRLLLLGCNARSHPGFTSISWRKTHGAALAAAGHVLSGVLGSLTIPASWETGRLQPWGSHPETDVLWSSRRLRIHHGDVRSGRPGRIRDIAHYPLAQRHLRVCTRGALARPNCSCCEKCLRTMVALSAYRVLDQFRTFDPDVDLVQALGALAAAPSGYVVLWEELSALEGLDPRVQRAVQGVIGRSRPPFWKRVVGRT